MANTNMEESSYGALERFLYFFLIPFVFTVILLGVLLSFFDNNFMNTVLKTAHQIPVIRSMVPEPSPVTAQEGGESSENLEKANKENAALIVSLNKQLATQNDSLTKLIDEGKQKDQTIKDLQTQLTDLQAKLQSKTLSDQEYTNKIKQTADIYASMTPTKAAPIVAALTLQERVLILGAMQASARSAILEKMDPKIAAESSILLKDVTPVKDTEIAALQERIQELIKDNPEDAASLSKSDIASTYAAMTPASAASVLLQLAANNQNQVIAILTSMQTSVRASILSAMASQDNATTASIAGKLGG